MRVSNHKTSRVFLIHATVIFQVLKYTITIRLFATVPLQFTSSLIYAITYPFDMFLKIFRQNCPLFSLFPSPPVLFPRRHGRRRPDQVPGVLGVSRP